MNPQNIYNKFYTKSKLELHEFFSLVNHDPTRHEKNNEIVKLGKYSKWILTIYGNIFFNINLTEEEFETKRVVLFEDLEKLEYYLNLFDKHKKKLPIELRNIFKFKSLNELFLLIKKFDIVDRTTKKNILEFIEDGIDYNFLGSSNNFLVYHILTEKGAATLGCNTEWCTSYGKYSLDKKHKTKGNLFHSYSNNLFILINNENKSEKYQFSFSKKMYMNADDTPIKLHRFYWLITFLIKKSYSIKITDHIHDKKIQQQLIQNLSKDIESSVDTFNDYINKLSNIVDINLFKPSEILTELIKKTDINEIFETLIKYNIKNLNIYNIIFHTIKNIDSIKKNNLYNIIKSGDNQLLHIIMFSFNKNKVKKSDIDSEIVNSIYSKYIGIRGFKHEFYE